MLWLIILGVVGLVFAPAMWLRPSPRQQRVTGLRDLARERGVAVRLERSPLHEGGDTLPAYRWRYPPQRPGPDFLLVRDAVASQALKPFLPGWRWRVEPLRPLPETAHHRLEVLLESLPEDTVVVESSAASLTLWWDESCPNEAFADLDERMKALSDDLGGRPDYPEAHRRAQLPNVPPSVGG
ncbi:preprotein translocase subunit YajC [Halomonas eurihalina]|uniref:Preprotein translocase subunit YajC n=1 Tax=Halomonas eurihalina TaxID=42566 RepID=A0A5D9CHU5_HALER|nr:preprotein translocase subunit YajC [Halomonas eurihalina]MDR5861242.1 preprotein translocase subunit YajC [Halomonas eurihalina]TZG31149.1 preprotein translocase subunit YajC [Halomonas eurihalina]